jgi:signal transduction histidine kinase
VAELDPQRITQALIQLVANALRFTEPGSVIALGGRIYGPEVRLWVRDEGTGIPPADQSRIFERFGRGTTPEARPSGTDDGAGLGLAIVDAIAVAHHGRVALTSEVGVGSTFTLCLPRAGRSLPPDGDTVVTVSVAAADRPAGRKPPSTADPAAEHRTTRESVPWPPS